MSDPNLKATLQNLLAQLEGAPATPAATSPAVPMSAPQPAPSIDYNALGTAIANAMKPQQPIVQSQWPASDKGPPTIAGPRIAHWSTELVSDPLRMSPAALEQMRAELGDAEANRKHTAAVMRIADRIRIDPKKK